MHLQLSWEKLPGQRPRAGHTATLVGRRIFVFGGRNGEQFLNDLWAFDLETEKWKQLQEHAPIAPRAYHSATLVGENRLWIIGGSDAKTMHNDVHVLSTESLQWSSPALKVEGMPRGTHASALHPLRPSCILIFGGYGGYRAGAFKWLDDFILFNTDTLQWEDLQPEGRFPCRRGYHTLTAIGHYVFLFGGKNDSGIVHEDILSVYNSIENKWFTPTTVGEGPSPRSNHASALLRGSAVIIHGGRYGQSRLNDFYSLEVSPDMNHLEWYKYDCKVADIKSRIVKISEAKDGPDGRAAHRIIVRESSVYMFGGYGGGRRTFSDMYVVRRFPHQGKQECQKVAFIALPVEETEDNEGWLSTKRVRASYVGNAGTSDACLFTPVNTTEKTMQHCSRKKSSSKRKSRSVSQEDLVKEVEVLQGRISALEQEVTTARAANSEISIELETALAERQDLRNQVVILQEQVEAESTKAGLLQKQVDDCIATTQRTDTLSSRLREELQAAVLAVKLKEKENQELAYQLKSTEKNFGERERSLENMKGMYEDVCLERDEYKSCVQKLEVELQKQIQTLQQTKSNYDAEKSFLMQEVAERKGTADRIFTELGMSKESCRAMQEHMQLLTRQLDQANGKLERYQKEKEELHRTNGALAAELRQISTARDTAESHAQLLKAEVESARTLIERNALEAAKLRENADETARHISTLHSSLKKAQEEVKFKTADNDRLRGHLQELEEFEQAQLRSLQNHIEKLQCARQSCPAQRNSTSRCD